MSLVYVSTVSGSSRAMLKTANVTLRLCRPMCICHIPPAGNFIKDRYVITP